MEQKLDSVEQRLDSVELRLDSVEQRLDTIDARLIKIELTHENRILPVLDEITVLYSSTFYSFNKKTEKIDRLELDVEVLKKVARKHSHILNQLWLKQ